jgi:hypothetical protein
VGPYELSPEACAMLPERSPETGGYCSISSNYRWREEWDAKRSWTTLRAYGPAEGGDTRVLGGDLVDVRVTTRGRSGRVASSRDDDARGVDGARRRSRALGASAPGKDAILRSAFLKNRRRAGPEGACDEGGRDRRRERPRHSASASGGAMGMARAGKGYREILGHYYKRTKAPDPVSLSAGVSPPKPLRLTTLGPAPILPFLL